jgi:energy-coupling factor transporter transmembrane protein EcfT
MNHSVQTGPLSPRHHTGVHPSFALLAFVMLGMLPFIFQDPRVLVFILILNLGVVSKLGWSKGNRRVYLLVGGVGGLFTTITWLPFVNLGHAYWESKIPLIGYPVQITDIGVLWALGMGLRIANVTLLSMFYLFHTSPRQIAMGLKGIGVPFSVGFLLSLIFRFIPLVKNDLMTIREAQLVRGLEFGKGSLLQKIRKYGFLLVPLIFTSLKRVQLIANALDAKGFKMRNRQHRFYSMPNWKTHEIIMLLIGLGVIAVLFYLARIHPSHFGIVISSRI